MRRLLLWANGVLTVLDDMRRYAEVFGKTPGGLPWGDDE
jgi:hypothetical protein